MSNLLATTTLSIGELISLLLSAAVSFVNFIGNLCGLPALVVNCGLFSASNPLAVLDEGLGLNGLGGSASAREGLEGGEAASTHATSLEHVSTEAASHASETSHASEAAHATKAPEGLHAPEATASEEIVMSEGIMALLLLLALGLFLASLASDHTCASHAHAKG